MFPGEPGLDLAARILRDQSYRQRNPLNQPTDNGIFHIRPGRSEAVHAVQ